MSFFWLARLGIRQYRTIGNGGRTIHWPTSFRKRLPDQLGPMGRSSPQVDVGIVRGYTWKVIRKPEGQEKHWFQMPRAMKTCSKSSFRAWIWTSKWWEDGRKILGDPLRGRFAGQSMQPRGFLYKTSPRSRTAFRTSRASHGWWIGHTEIRKSRGQWGFTVKAHGLYDYEGITWTIPIWSWISVHPTIW